MIELTLAQMVLLKKIKALEFSKEEKALLKKIVAKIVKLASEKSKKEN